MPKSRSRHLLAMLSLIVATPAGAAECVGAPPEMDACLERQTDAEKATLSGLYDKALAGMPDADPQDERRDRAVLIRAQSAWASYADAQCVYVGGQEGGSNAWVSAFQATCLRDEYAKRIAFFQQPPSPEN